MITHVINTQIYTNPYHRQLFSALAHRYVSVKGTVGDATIMNGKGMHTILHIHWEESIFRGCRTRQQGRNRAHRFIEQIGEYKSNGGKIVWTLHNLKPHDRGHHGAFLELRRRLIPLVDRFLLHSADNIAAVAALDIHLPMEKISILAHPSYDGVYEPAHALVDTQIASDSKTVLLFGRVKEYKSTNPLLQVLDETFLTNQGLSIQITGQADLSDAYVEEMVRLTANRRTVNLDLRHVPESEVATLLRSVSGLLIPYEQMLTSGVAVLGATLGTPMVAPRLPHLLDLVPKSGHTLLYEIGNADDLKRAVTELKTWDAARRQIYLQQARAHTQAYGPLKTSLRLGAIYDRVSRQ